ncbi:MAG TPA: 6,7-dimethyl-8-ribityllumazine synthase [Acidimicrobiia bacterium]|nr:6,7-dimethyl-8-ribityllumazine synthase [Acidimicrobiia bacterium]
MIRTFEGSDAGSGLHVGVVAAQWNQAIVDRLLEGALQRLEKAGVDQVTVVRVPGALELPIAALKLAQQGCDAIVALGAVIKGETDHYEIVVRESARGISSVALETGVPVANGILAVHDYSHAVERAGTGDANKGVEAVEAALSTANAIRDLEAT